MPPFNLIFFDEPATRQNLLPFTWTRPVSAIRVGILTIQEKWEKWLGAAGSHLAVDYLAGRYPLKRDPERDQLYINGCICPDEGLSEAVRSLDVGEALVDKEVVIAARLDRELQPDPEVIRDACQLQTYSGNVAAVGYPWDIFRMNAMELESDYRLVTLGRTSEILHPTNTLIGPAERLFIEQGAKVAASVINTESGPVYIGKGAEVMEGCLIRGGLCLGEHSILKLGAKVYGATTIGPHSKIGGEVNNIVVFGYSNKGHDGFLGNSVLGSWCNLGADTNTSNLKNNYSNVRVWNYQQGTYVDAGVQFCGLLMGDHSKSGINTMFNTGTVVGVSANIYGAGFPQKFIPSFSWGEPGAFTEYRIERALEVAERVMGRRNVDFKATDESIFRHIFDASKQYR